MKEVRLNNGVMMPAIGFGVYQIPVDETERIVSEALETGYRMIGKNSKRSARNGLSDDRHSGFVFQ